VYKRILPSLGDYITNHGGQVNLSHVDVILAEVGSIEDYVFTMKHENEEREKQRREQFKARKKNANGRSLDDPRTAVQQQPPKVKGRAARILEKQKTDIPLKKETKGKIKSSHMKSKDNLNAAMALKKALEGNVEKKEQIGSDEVKKDEDTASTTEVEHDRKRKFGEVEQESKESKENNKRDGVVGDMEEEFGDDEDDDDESEEDRNNKVALAFKERVKDEQKKKLDEYARTVEDKVRLHEKGWKDRYYSDKCKADDVENHGGRDHLFRSYVIGLCWVMKYYYEGCKFEFYVFE